MTLYSLRTTAGRENIVVDMLLIKIKSEALNVKAVLHPAELKGYVFLEGNLADIHKALQGMLHIRSLMEKPIGLSDIQRFLEAKRIAVDVGDEVEIVGGAFKGEKGLIKRIDKTKDEVTVELLEASMPIPITIATNFVKILKKAARREGGEAPVVKEEEVKKFSLEDLRKAYSEGA